MAAWWPIFRPALESYADTYAKNGERLRHALLDAIARQIQTVDLVLVLTHFPETYLNLQDLLLNSGLDAQLLRPPIHAGNLPLNRLDSDEAPRPSGIDPLRTDQPMLEGSQSVLALGLSEMLEMERHPAALDRRRRASIIVVERHPLPRHDRRVIAFARSLGCRVRLGYFIALDDPLVAPFLGEWTEMLLEQWGFKEANLITSDLVTRRLDRARQRLDRQVVDETLCDSPSEWLSLNCIGTHYEKLVQQWLATKRSPSENSRDSIVSTDSDDDDDDDEDDEDDDEN